MSASSIRNVLSSLACALVLAGTSSPALASVAVGSTAFGFDLSDNPDAVIDFDSPTPAGFTLAGGLVRNLDDGQGAEPAKAQGVKETSNYLSVNPGDTATLLSEVGYSKVSLYWGSIDWYNTLSLLDINGNAIASFTGSDIVDPASGDQLDGLNNRRVTFTVSGETSPIYGLQFDSSHPAFEVDNIGFYGSAIPQLSGLVPSVPEPATWAMMLAGFGMVGAAMRKRPQQRTTVAFA